MRQINMFLVVIVGLAILNLGCKTGQLRQDSTQPAPQSNRLQSIKLKDLEGNQIQLKDHLGKPIVINFWATWCGPCIEEMKSIQEVSQLFKDDIIFLAASNESSTKIKTFMKQHAYDLHFVQLEVPYIDAYVVELPTTLLIDRNGKIMYEEEGFRVWTQPGLIKKLNQLISTGTK